MPARSPLVSPVCGSEGEEGLEEASLPPSEPLVTLLPGELPPVPSMPELSLLELPLPPDSPLLVPLEDPLPEPSPGLPVAPPLP